MRTNGGNRPFTTLRLLFARQAKGKRKLVLRGFCNSYTPLPSSTQNS
jgi:hypothetical protein